MFKNRDCAIALRLEYQACIKLAEETDSKKEDALLRQEAALLLDDLKQTCPHEDVVITHPATLGCYSNDYEDSDPECRKCLCCGVAEATYNDFELLTTKPMARFHWREHRNDREVPEQVRTPLKFLLADVIEVALAKGLPVR